MFKFLKITKKVLKIYIVRFLHGSKTKYYFKLQCKNHQKICAKEISGWGVGVNTYSSSIFVFGKDFFLAYIYLCGGKVSPVGIYFQNWCGNIATPPCQGRDRKQIDRDRENGRQKIDRDKEKERTKERERKRYIQKRTKERDTLRDRKQSVRENELRKSPSIVAAYFYPQLCKEILLLLFGKINFNRIKVHENWKGCEEVFFL